MSLWQRIVEKLFPPIRSYIIQRGARKTMREMARLTHPKEAFGVLRGKHKKGMLVVNEVAFQPFTNTTSSAHVVIDHYTITDLTGTFHSHPTPNFNPSKADLRLFNRYPGVHCIVAYPYTNVAVYNQKGELLDLLPID